MRRTPFVLTATAAGLAGVISYHAHSKSFGSFNPATARSLSSPKRARPHQAQRGAASGAGAGSSAGSGAGAGSSVPVPGVSSPTALLPHQDTGPLVPYGYGELAVKVSVSGGKITSVDVVGLRTADQYSQSLAQQVVPMLRSEVLQAQSGNINGISGATYTSEAFAMSLQGALKRING